MEFLSAPFPFGTVVSSVQQTSGENVRENRKTKVIKVICKQCKSQIRISPANCKNNTTCGVWPERNSLFSFIRYYFFFCSPLKSSHKSSLTLRMQYYTSTYFSSNLALTFSCSILIKLKFTSAILFRTYRISFDMHVLRIPSLTLYTLFFT